MDLFWRKLFADKAREMSVSEASKVMNNHRRAVGRSKVIEVANKLRAEMGMVAWKG